ncbi:MAG: hypothetical protein S0880_30670 [Actinomycetota bacterium]|nr:hypothetical protein [Actinomycetota bacterium]
MSDIVRIDLGASIFEAEILVRSLESDGFTVQLLRNEHPETGGVLALGSSALLVRAAEEEQVRARIAEAGY